MLHIMKMERKTNLSRCLKQFDGLTWLSLTPLLTTDLLHWKTGKTK